VNCAANAKSTRYCGVKTALYNAVNAISTSSVRIRIGLMMFNESGANSFSGGSPTGSKDGAYVRYSLRDMNANNKQVLLDLIRSLDVGNDKGSSTQNALAYEEARRYFAGIGVMNGDNTAYKVDMGIPQLTTPPGADANYTASVTPAMTSNHTTYISPVADGCQQNFILYISNGPPDSGENGRANTILTGLYGGTKPSTYPYTLNYNPNNYVTSNQLQSNAGDWMDEFANTLWTKGDVPNGSNPHTIVSYGVALYDNSKAEQQASPVSGRALSYSASQGHGGGKYFDATDANTLQNEFETIFTEIQSVDSEFVSATLPLAVNIQGNYLNQVYMGLFRPDANDSPRWIGNVKQYRLKYDASTGTVSLVDFSSPTVSAVSPTTGFINPLSTSFWSTALTGTVSTGTVSFWTNNPEGTATTLYPNLPSQDAPDGAYVEKGGVAQQLRSSYLVDQSTRNVYSCALSGGVGNCSGALSSFAFNTTNITGSTYQTAFAASDATDLANIVNWVRGTDNNSGSTTGADPTGPGKTSTNQTVTVRPYVHGDVLHSRPVILNYGTSDAGPLMAFYGANDGMLHAVCAGQNGSTNNCTGSAAPGQEVWAFVPPEAFAKLKRLRDGSPKVAITGVIASPTPTTKNYFFDGTIDVFSGTNPNTNSAQKILYVSARRGGSFIYAFDVTSIAAPLFLWKIDSTQGSFGKLAQTWSMPQVAHVRNSSHPWVVVFGAGYCGHDNNSASLSVGEDADPPQSCPTTHDGSAVYVVDAFSGAVVKTFSAAANGGAAISKSIASDVALVDQNRDGFVDRIYVGDTGGTVWRMDVDDTSESNWTLVELAVSKSNSQGSTDTAVEKFLYAPDIVTTGAYNAVLLGSGDREHPLSTSSNNRFYMFKDTNMTLLTPTTAAQVQAITDYTNMVDVTAVSDPAAEVASGTATGWYYPLTTDGEKTVNAPLTLAGITYFGTNTPNPTGTPTPGTCNNLGIAKAYALTYGGGVGAESDGSAYVTLTGGGLPPSPVGGMVQIDSTTIVPFCIGCGAMGTPPPASGGTGTEDCSTACGVGASSIEACKVCLKLPETRKKQYWYNKTDQ
jgi:type IV pilus assembly protein PilY1